MVLDASAVLDWILQTPRAAALERRLFAGAATSPAWHAPHLLDVECAQVLRRMVRARMVSDTRATAALEDLTELPVIRYPHDWLLPRMWELRHHLTAYDAAYVALAEALRATLVTGDRRLAGVPGLRARVEVV